MIEKKIKEKENPQNRTEKQNELTFEKFEASNLETHLIHWSPYLEENDSHNFFLVFTASLESALTV